MHKKTLPNGQGIKVFLIYHVRHLVYLRAEDLYGITRNFHLRCMPASTTYFDSSQPVLHASSFCIAVRDCSIPSSFFSALHSVQLVGTLSLSLLGYATRYCGCIYASITPCSSVLQVSMQGYTCCPLLYLFWFPEGAFPAVHSMCSFPMLRLYTAPKARTVGWGLALFRSSVC